MFAYLIRRILYIIPISFGVTVLVFALVHMAPGDPLSAVVPADAPEEMVQELKKAYGFDKPLPIQYVTWLGRVLVGDLGVSIARSRNVADELAIAGNIDRHSCPVAIAGDIDNRDSIRIMKPNPYVPNRSLQDVLTRLDSSQMSQCDRQPDRAMATHVEHADVVEEDNTGTGLGIDRLA